MKDIHYLKTPVASLRVSKIWEPDIRISKADAFVLAPAAKDDIKLGDTEHLYSLEFVVFLK